MVTVYPSYTVVVRNGYSVSFLHNGDEKWLRKAKVDNGKLIAPLQLRKPLWGWFLFVAYVLGNVK